MNTKIFHLFDNIVLKQGFRSLWGFSVLVRFGKLTILVDTGSNGRVLLDHMSRLEVGDIPVDYLFITHRHWDHIGGLDSVLDQYPDIQLVVPESLSDHLIDDMRNMGYPVTVVHTSPVTIADGIHSTGTLENSACEQAIMLETPKGVLLITGCAHPGLRRILQASQSYLDVPIYIIMGGFHLLKSDKHQVLDTIHMLKENNVRYVIPSHCTGEWAIRLIRRKMGKQFIRGGTGGMYSF